MNSATNTRGKSTGLLRKRPAAFSRSAASPSFPLLSHGGLAESWWPSYSANTPNVRLSQNCCLHCSGAFLAQTVMACCTRYSDFCENVLSLGRASINIPYRAPPPSTCYPPGPSLLFFQALNAYSFYFLLFIILALYYSLSN